MPGYLIIDQGKILAVVKELDQKQKLAPLEDVGDLAILPGLVDTHVHINEPGRTDWEGFETATKAAAAGGITTLVDMPLNCLPVTTSAENLQSKLSQLSNKLMVDCGFWGGVTSENLADLDQLLKAGVLGVKSFLIDSGIPEFPPVNQEQLEEAMTILKKYQRPYLIHAEIDTSLETCGDTSANSQVDHRYSTFLASRPHQFETKAINLLIHSLKKIKTPIHIVHLSSAEALGLIKAAKEQGLPLTAETCPHYLCLESEAIPDRHTEFKCCPPIREKANQKKLWRALESGLIDLVVSDHSPCTVALKKLTTGNFSEAWGGVASLQIGLPLMLTHASENDLALEKIITLMTAAPARLCGLDHQKGQLKKGLDADFILLDLKGKLKVDQEKLFHKNKLTPYHQMTLSGKVEQTFLRGEKIYEAKTGYFAPPLGKTLLKGINA